ncbi:CinA family protein [Acetobacter estunensis]|uniref:CinA family protein n=1 Tax=Acetobacter estunensis TaxID=104097 RepID=UPI001C2DB175|nr:CinA family protein [Acetobacter estunensis]MBV1836490.1 CinA family protein [Acetobacter estunensis]
MTASLPSAVLIEAKNLLEALKAAGLMIVTAESCTGGLITSALTHHAGSSVAVSGGFVTYSNTMKESCLGIAPDLLKTWGAVSEPVAKAMASGALDHGPDADISISTTGIAGPDGGTPTKPVGLVWFGVQRRGQPPYAESQIFDGDRESVRAQTVQHALRLAHQAI